MQKTVALKKNMRVGKRFTTLFRTRFLMAHSQRYRDCIIIDIGRTGACAKIPAGENIMIGDEIVFELPTKELNNFTVKGETVWSQKIENGFIIGVRFKKRWASNLD